MAIAAVSHRRAEEAFSTIDFGARTAAGADSGTGSAGLGIAKDARAGPGGETDSGRNVRAERSLKGWALGCPEGICRMGSVSSISSLYEALACTPPSDSRKKNPMRAGW